MTAEIWTAIGQFIDAWFVALGCGKRRAEILVDAQTVALQCEMSADRKYARLRRYVTVGEIIAAPCPTPSQRGQAYGLEMKGAVRERWAAAPEREHK